MEKNDLKIVILEYDIHENERIDRVIGPCFGSMSASLSNQINDFHPWVFQFLQVSNRHQSPIFPYHVMDKFTDRCTYRDGCIIALISIVSVVKLNQIKLQLRWSYTKKRGNFSLFYKVEIYMHLVRGRVNQTKNTLFTVEWLSWLPSYVTPPWGKMGLNFKHDN